MERANRFQNIVNPQDANLVPKTGNNLGLYSRFMLSKISDVVPFRTHAQYPKTGISHFLYFSFRREMFSVINKFGGEPRVFEAEAGKILDKEKYRLIVKEHFAFHLRKGENPEGIDFSQEEPQ